MSQIEVKQAPKSAVHAANALTYRLLASASDVLRGTIGDKLSPTNADLLFLDICMQKLLKIDAVLMAEYLHHMVDLRRDQELDRPVDTAAAQRKSIELLKAAMNAAQLHNTTPEGRA